MLSRDRGFDLAGISCPVHLRHGTEDANVPVAVARTFIGGLPTVEARVVDGEGHSLGAVLSEEVMTTVLDAART